MYGQLAGANYGEEGIPPSGERLAMAEEIGAFIASWGSGRSPGEARSTGPSLAAGAYGRAAGARSGPGRGGTRRGRHHPEAMPPRLRGRAWGVAEVSQGLGVILALLILPRSLSGKTRPMKSGLP